MNSANDYVEKEDRSEHIFDKRIVDVAAQLTAGLDTTIDLETSVRLRKKIDRNLMPLMCTLYLMAFADKAALGQAGILGIFPGAHLTQNQFNWLGTIFYLSYLVFQYPQNLALQYFPVGKWMSINIIIWAISLCVQAGCHSFGALFACRFIMGICEGSIIPGFLIVTAMFYTREEQTRRTAYWFLMTGVSIVFLGFLSFGVLHIKSGKFMPWQWLMIITGTLTLMTAIAFWFFFPDSSATAWFLTPEERVLAIYRIKVNQAGIENKHWKRDQFIETFTDPKTWIVALFTVFISIPSSLTNQRQIIVNQFGFTTLQTTLLGCVDGIVDSGAMVIGVILATRFKNSRGYVAALSAVPAIVGSILVNTLPSHVKVGLLMSYWTSICGFTAFVILLGWIASITAGHTKRITTNAIMMCAYALANVAGPFMWKKKYAPRNHVPWTIITACTFVSGVLILVLRFMLAAENKRRDAEPYDNTYDDACIVVTNADGTKTEKLVDKSFLDLTDKQNRDFRYVL